MTGKLSTSPAASTAGPRSDPPADARTGTRRRLVVLPTLNEEVGLARTLESIHAVPFHGSAETPTVLVVDGHSTDGTLDVARRAGLEVLLQHGRGKGAALREAIAWASAEGYASVAVMDADATYPASALPAMFELLEQSHDLVIGVRRPARSPFATPRELVHRIGNGLLNFAAAQASGRPVLDICSGLWGVRAAEVAALHLESTGFEIEAELFVKGFTSGWRVAQIPIRYDSRLGEAKLHAVRDGARILLAISRHALRSRLAARTRPSFSRSSPLGEHGGVGAVLLALAPAHVELLSTPERWSEAEELADWVLRTAPGASVSTAILRAGSPVGEAWAAPLTAPATAGTPTVVVVLGSSASAEYLIGIPRTQRVLFVPPPAARDRPVPPSEFGPRFRAEGRATRRWRAGFILGSAIERSGAQKELAMLLANAAVTELRVYRRSPVLGGLAEGWAGRLGLPLVPWTGSGGR